MTNKKLFARLACALPLVFAFLGCDDNVAPDMRVGEITISNIPAQIPVHGSPGQYVDTFRIYLNASNFMDHTDPPAAKGLVQVTDAMRQSDGTIAVTIDLRYPNPGFGEAGYDGDPNLPTPSWFGTAFFYSIMIAPQNTGAHGENAIWVKAGTDLNRESQSLNWSALMDFRVLTLPGMAARQTALFEVFLDDPHTLPTR